MWNEIYLELSKATRTPGTRLYRGQSDATWKLFPTLGRFSGLPKFGEENTYFDFVTRAGDLLPRGADSWSVLFAMQHHGLPTRLLDWTETMGVALYFAVKDGDGDAAVWVLNPFELNKWSIDREQVLHPDELEGTYDEFYLSKTKQPKSGAVAISPMRHEPRVFHQRSGFTLHHNLDEPLEKLFPQALKKIVIPKEVRRDANRFPLMAGTTEFSLFPDLDGLSREIYAENFRNLPRKE